MRYFLILLFAFLTACGSTLPVVKPFKMEIQQGNVVTSKMLLQLRPGMTKSQVKFIMGTPLIVDSFHSNRWDYFYQLRQAGKIMEQRRVILDFDKDLLTKVRGDVVPEGTAGAATGNETSAAKTITLEPKSKQDEGMLEKLKFWKDDEKTAIKPEAAKSAKETSWTDKLKFWKKDEAAKESVVKGPERAPATREKTDALQANSSAPAGDAVSMDMPNVAAPSADVPNVDMPNTDTPSVLAVPIGGVLAADAPAAEAPVPETPTVAVPATEAPVVLAPVVEALPIEPPKLEVPKIETPKIEAPKVEPEIESVTPEPTLVPMPAAKTGERLIFRMDRNLDLKNLDLKSLQAPVEALPEAEIKSDATSDKMAAKPKKAEAPLPAEEAPGYFERMLEKIGF